MHGKVQTTGVPNFNLQSKKFNVYPNAQGSGFPLNEVSYAGASHMFGHPLKESKSFVAAVTRNHLTSSSDDSIVGLILR